MEIKKVEGKQRPTTAPPENEGQFVVLSKPEEMGTKGLTLRCPDGVIVQLTPDDIVMAYVTEAFRKRMKGDVIV